MSEENGSALRFFTEGGFKRRKAFVPVNGAKSNTDTKLLKEDGRDPEEDPGRF